MQFFSGLMQFGGVSGSSCGQIQFQQFSELRVFPSNSFGDLGISFVEMERPG